MKPSPLSTAAAALVLIGAVAGGCQSNDTNGSATNTGELARSSGPGGEDEQAAGEEGGGSASPNEDQPKAKDGDEPSSKESSGASGEGSTRVGDPSKGLEAATFAGGCFWCMEPPFDEVKGVKQTLVGYTGGEKKNPTYEEVSAGKTNHAEAIRVVFDPDEVGYEKLLHVFWHNIDPTAEDRQFVDVGKQYRTGIFHHSEAQKKAALASKKELEKTGPFDEPIVTPVQQAGPFYRAEDYHQNFYKKNPDRYHGYRSGSGRDEFLERVWGEDDGNDGT